MHACRKDTVAGALESCSAKLRRKDGVIVVGATSIHGQLAWASVEMVTPEPLTQEHCALISGGSHCTLSDPEQIPPPPPPSDCVVRLSDESSECSTYVKGCVQGERRVIACLRVSNDGKEVIYQGCNVHIRNALGATATKDATGNLIIGWNESVGTPDRSGSHNVVVGQQHSWSATGGVVAGFANTISAESASILGGARNVADGFGAAILGGWRNTASGEESTVSGGASGMAVGLWSSVAGGDSNTASGEYSFVGGGAENAATGDAATVTGGSVGEASGNVAIVAGGTGNLAAGMEATVAGGEYNVAGADDYDIGPTVVGGFLNVALGHGSVAVGGDENRASGPASTVSGGERNVANGQHSTVNGGAFNSTTGSHSTVGGGAHRTASGESDWVAGSLFEDE